MKKVPKTSEWNCQHCSNNLFVPLEGAETMSSNPSYRSVIIAWLAVSVILHCCKVCWLDIKPDV